MKKILICWVLCSTLSNVYADSPKLSYKGVALGVSKSEFLAVMPAFVCHTSESRMCSYSYNKCVGSTTGIASNPAAY